MSEHHTPSDLSGIARAKPQAAATAVPDATSDFQDALDELLEFTSEDAIHACSSMPGGRGCYGPDVSRADALYAVVMEAARKAFTPPAAPSAPTADRPDNGLCTVRGINARCGGGA